MQQLLRGANLIKDGPVWAPAGDSSPACRDAGVGAHAAVEAAAANQAQQSHLRSRPLALTRHGDSSWTSPNGAMSLCTLERYATTSASVCKQDIVIAVLRVLLCACHHCHAQSSSAFPRFVVYVPLPTGLGSKMHHLLAATCSHCATAPMGYWLTCCSTSFRQGMQQQ